MLGTQFVYQSAFHALRPKDLRRRPEGLSGIISSVNLVLGMMAFGNLSTSV